MRQKEGRCGKCLEWGLVRGRRLRRRKGEIKIYRDEDGGVGEAFEETGSSETSSEAILH